MTSYMASGTLYSMSHNILTRKIGTVMIVTRVVGN